MVKTPRDRVLSTVNGGLVMVVAARLRDRDGGGGATEKGRVIIKNSINGFKKVRTLIYNRLRWRGEKMCQALEIVLQSTCLDPCFSCAFRTPEMRGVTTPEMRGVTYQKCSLRRWGMKLQKLERESLPWGINREKERDVPRLVKKRRGNNVPNTWQISDLMSLASDINSEP